MPYQLMVPFNSFHHLQVHAACTCMYMQVHAINTGTCTAYMYTCKCTGVIDY